MKKILSLMLVTAMLASGCSAEKAPANEEAGSKEDVEAVEKTDLGNATVVGLNVSIRKEAGTSHEKVGTLSFPSEVYLLEKTDDTETIGDYDDYWYRIRSGDTTGWCYGAFLANDDELGGTLKSRLEDLLPLKGTSVSESVARLKSIIALNSSPYLADKGVLRIMKIQERLIAQTAGELVPLTETLYGYTIDELRHPENLPDGAIKTLMGKYSDMGFSIYMTEGMYYLEPNPKFLLGNFKTAISDELFDYLSYRSNEVDRHTYSDAAVIITWDELGERMVDWENFMADYPDSSLLEDVESMYEMYRFTFLIGTSNTPAYTYPDEILNSELLAAYENYVSKFPESSMTPALEKLLVLLDDEEYHKSERVQEFINPYNPWN